MALNYFIIGEEELLVRDAISEICSQHQSNGAWDRERVNSWSELRNKLATQAMFAERRVFIADYAALCESDPNPRDMEDILAGHPNILIVYALEKPDRRVQAYKLLAQVAAVREISAPRGGELIRWVMDRASQLGAGIDRKAAQELIYLAGTNLLALENELKKLLNYSTEITVHNVRLLATRAMHATIFDLVDAVVQGQGARALYLVEDLFRSGAAEPYILHMLARQYRLLFRLQMYRQKGYSYAEIQKMMPMHPYAFQRLCQQAGQAGLAYCARSIHALAEADWNYKTGARQGLSLLQPLIVKIAKK